MYEILSEIVSAPADADSTILMLSAIVVGLLITTVIRCIWKIFEI